MEPLLFSGESFPSLAGGIQSSYSIDGIQVPASHFGRMFDFAFGGIFGVVERQARFSAPRLLGYSLRYNNGETSSIYNDLDTAIGRMEGGETVLRNWLVSDNSWAVSSVISRIRREGPAEDIKAAIVEAENILKKDKCKTAIEGLLRKAAMQNFKDSGGNYDKLSLSDKAEVDKSINDYFNAKGLIDAVNSATKDLTKVDELNTGDENHTKATVSRPKGVTTITFYAGFFNDIYSGKTGIVVNNQEQKPYKGDSTTLQDRAFSIIHEAIHALDPRFSDGFIGRFTGRKPKDKDLTKDEGSVAINNFIKENCK